MKNEIFAALNEDGMASCFEKHELCLVYSLLSCVHLSQSLQMKEQEGHISVYSNRSCAGYPELD